MFSFILGFLVGGIGMSLVAINNHQQALDYRSLAEQVIGEEVPKLRKFWANVWEWIKSKF
jgi:hypothetical protein